MHQVLQCREKSVRDRLQLQRLHLCRHRHPGSQVPLQLQPRPHLCHRHPLRYCCYRWLESIRVVRA